MTALSCGSRVLMLQFRACTDNGVCLNMEARSEAAASTRSTRPARTVKAGVSEVSSSNGIQAQSGQCPGYSRQPYIRLAVDPKRAAQRDN